MSGTTERRATKIILVAMGAFTIGSAAGCSGGDQAVDQEAAPRDMRGQWWVYGDLPGKSPGEQDIPRQTAFEPKNYAVVYLKLEGAHLTARHAHFPVIAGSDDKVDCAINYLETGKHDTKCEPYDDPADGLDPISEDFENFRFGSQHRVYVFAYNANPTQPQIGFNRITPISFTPFGAFDQPVVAGPATKDPNLSFYDATVGAFPGSSRVGLSFNNYYRGKDGKELEDHYNGSNSSLYSINFNLVLCREPKCDLNNPAEVIPLAIDPDTGNGWGSKP